VANGKAPGRVICPIVAAPEKLRQSQSERLILRISRFVLRPADDYLGDGLSLLRPIE
jgi:hypothetical protein